MPKALKVKCFILFFAVFIVIGRGDVRFEYLDCGSYFEINSVTVSNCTATPCVFSPGQNFTVQILITEVAQFDRTELTTKAFLWMFGSSWPLEITPLNPCTSQWHCPVLQENNLTYTADVHLLDNVIKRPAHVEVLITYDQNGEMFQALCVEFAVNLE
ncbi:hypothetical protein NQ315_007003 [Exocentrus adspersus]|uniref:MD-2-related lipid-recognition domain-containing protein n=1 Tax=Exocentrus adspersus TaxID=1586481 RepID=A0AAV8WC70_9CUCU|nr:hypothetical protein NQ315_007003 [Exocentrus adspersus]